MQITRTHALAGQGAGARARSRAPCLTLVVLCCACGNLTRVSAPDLVQPKDLANPAGAQASRAYAIATFASAYAGQVSASGLISDELADRSAATSPSFESDKRVLQASLAQGDYPYAGLTNARFYALAATASLEQYSPTPAWRIGELFATAGYAEAMFAENMCNGIPVATVVNGLPQGTPMLTRHALLAAALSHFDSAKAYAAASTGSDSILNLARVGEGRALLDSGDVAGASAAVDSVARGFVYDPPYDGQHQSNGIFGMVNQSLQASVSNFEGENGLPFVSANDPRVPITTAGLENGSSGPDTVYGFGAYNSAATPMPLASGIEAALIQAEALLKAGQIAAWAAALRALRADSADTHVMFPPEDSLPADSAELASPSAQVGLMFRERAFWLFLTGHRHGDLRRLVRQYALPVESVFPTGLYQGGPSHYGTAAVFVPGVSESGNPTYTGCIDQLP